MRFLGVELYFDDLPIAREFYRNVLHLKISDEQPGHHVQLSPEGGAFVCLEKKGAENYPSRDKAVLFFEVADLAKTVEEIVKEKIVHVEADKQGHPLWAVIHDPEGHNILLLQCKS